MTVDRAARQRLADLAQKAGAAWDVKYLGGTNYVVVDGTGGPVATCWETDGHDTETLAEYIAAADPGTVLALLADLDDAERERSILSKAVMKLYGGLRELRGEPTWDDPDMLEKRLARLLAEHGDVS